MNASPSPPPAATSDSSALANPLRHRGNEVAAGAWAGVAGTVIGHPLDTVKSRLQTHPEKYRGMLDCIVKVSRVEGFRGLYKGLAPPMAQLVLMNALSFATFYEFKELCHRALGSVDSMGDQADISSGFLAGAITGALGGVFSTPFELLKVQMQLDFIQANRFKGSWDCGRTILRENGVPGLYRGLVVNTLRETVFCTAYFGLYEFLKVHPVQPFPNSLGIAMAGGVSGMAAWFLSYPLDCVKGNIQGQSVHVRTSLITAASEIIRKRGIRGLYSGLVPSITRAFIVSATRFSAFEQGLRMMNSLTAI